MVLKTEAVKTVIDGLRREASRIPGRIFAKSLCTPIKRQYTRFRLRNSGDAEATAPGYAEVGIVLSERAEASFLDWISVDTRLCPVRLAKSYEFSEQQKSLDNVVPTNKPALNPNRPHRRQLSVARVDHRPQLLLEHYRGLRPCTCTLLLFIALFGCTQNAHTSLSH
ncbi:hypothetical protein T265_06102 [Opisthorchis viverrini]|uniref:Uncharacterized protein n=1 Tax=Opisthorchis viverrini TaxID=6198 RepID=A0A074ZID9_OPIVI|nr:hypothetical protein T265_06102 [Opisthorchis viverrini]KER26741.1 hypothetical protein T265_06102 [Opisthorchis viverrini]